MTLLKKAIELQQVGDINGAIAEYEKINFSNTCYTQAQFNIWQLAISDTNTHNINNDVMVSIILPVFNVETYLVQSLLSALNQSYRNIEIIAVNDGSDDNSLKVLKLYSAMDGRLKVINLKSNTMGGIGIPNNIGVRAAKGKYIAYLDGDDILDRSAIECMLKQALKFDTDIVIADFCTFTQHDNGVQIQKSYDKDKWRELPLSCTFNPKVHSNIFSLSPVPWRKLYKKSFLLEKNIHFLEGDYFFEDNPYHWHVLTNAMSVILLDAVVVYHRLGRLGQTTNGQSLKFSAHFNHLISIHSYLIKEGVNDKNIWLQFLNFTNRLTWVIDRQEDLNFKNLIKKRYSQTVNQILYKLPLSQSHNDELKIVTDKLKSHCCRQNLTHSTLSLSILVFFGKDVDLVGDFLNNLSKVNFNIEVFLIGDATSIEHTDDLKIHANKHHVLYFINDSASNIGLNYNLALPLITSDYVYCLDIHNSIELTDLIHLVYIAKKNMYDLLLFGLNHHEEFYQKITNNPNILRKKILSDYLSNTQKSYCIIVQSQLLHSNNIFFGYSSMFYDIPYLWHSLVTAKNIGVHTSGVNYTPRNPLNRIDDYCDKEIFNIFEMIRYTENWLTKYADYVMIVQGWHKLVNLLITNISSDRMLHLNINEYPKVYQKFLRLE